MVIFQYNLYIFGIHLWTMLYPKPCYNEPCYKEVVVYWFWKQTRPELAFTSVQVYLALLLVYGKYPLHCMAHICYTYLHASIKEMYPGCELRGLSFNHIIIVFLLFHDITKTHLFKYIDKNLWYFSYFCSKHRLWIIVRTASVSPQSVFSSKNKKNNVYPCKPQFYYTKVGFKGVKII